MWFKVGHVVNYEESRNVKNLARRKEKALLTAVTTTAWWSTNGRCTKGYKVEWDGYLSDNGNDDRNLWPGSKHGVAGNKVHKRGRCNKLQ